MIFEFVVPFLLKLVGALSLDYGKKRTDDIDMYADVIDFPAIVEGLKRIGWEHVPAPRA